MSLFILFSTLLYLFIGRVDAQLVNGQYFTRGLAINNAPAPDSEFTVGGTIAVSVDVSGNGRLPEGSWGPNSTLPSGFISLSIFIVSGSHNVTVVDGTSGQFLSGEPGSTVKHLNYVVPNCLPEGKYDYTYYEVSRMNDTMYFGITPIAIQIKNPGGSSGACNDSISNPVLPRPQNDSAPAQNPFTGGLALNVTSGEQSSVTLAMPTFLSMVDTVTATQPGTTSSSTLILSPNANNWGVPAAQEQFIFPIRRGFSNSARRGSFGLNIGAGLLALSVARWDTLIAGLVIWFIANSIIEELPHM